MTPEDFVKFKDLPFDEAIIWLRDKLNLPTAHWDDLLKEAHIRGFTVAGALSADMLQDFHDAVNIAIKDGTTVEDFRKSFDKIVERYGWDYHGGRDWRSRLIYETNIRTAYASGRYKQQTKKSVVKLRPYLEYRHGDTVIPRPEHVKWDGLVLPADDPWWDTHYPPNGWGCKCRVFSVSKRDLKKKGKAGPDTAPDNGTYQWKDRSGKTHTIPEGIDPGWDYNVGQKPLSDWEPDMKKYTPEIRKELKNYTGRI